MKKTEEKIIDELIDRYPVLQQCKAAVGYAVDMLIQCYERGGKLIVAGNGGSGADSGHIVGELMKSFRVSRPLAAHLKASLVAVDSDRGSELAETLESPLGALSLVEHSALITAFSNDVKFQSAYAQQLLGYGKVGDVFLGISTSGNSQNIIDAAIVAKAIGVYVLGLTGCSGGRLADFADLTICVPEKETFKIQELHLPIYHCLCQSVEAHFFGLEVSM